MFSHEEFGLDQKFRELILSPFGQTFFNWVAQVHRNREGAQRGWQTVRRWNKCDREAERAGMSWSQPTFIGMVWIQWSHIIQTTPPPPEIIPFPLLTLYVTNIRLIRKLKFCQTRVSSVQFNFLIFWLTAKFPQRCWLDDQCFFSWIPTCRLHLVQVHVTNCTLISSLSGGSALSFHTHLYRKHSAEYIPYNTQSLTVPGYIYLYISSCALQTLSPLGIITFDRPAVYYLVN